MYAIILVICAANTPPHPMNPTCMSGTYTRELHATEAECRKAVPALIERLDADLKPHGYEAYRIPGHECRKRTSA